MTSRPSKQTKVYVLAQVFFAVVLSFIRKCSSASSWNKLLNLGRRRSRSSLRIQRHVYYTGKYWNDIPYVSQEVFHRRATGHPDLHWDSFLLKRRGQPFQSVLVLNAGNGWVERSLMEKGIIRSGIGVEYLQQFVDDANTEAEAKGYNLTYYQCNVNVDLLPAGKYDLVLNHAAVHHVARLDFVFQQILSLLLPTGWFVSVDYIGPHRNQYPAPLWRKLEQINAQIPAVFRQRLAYPHLPTMLATDATEAQHSEMIVEAMRRYFFIDLYKPLGGAIAYPLLTHNRAIHSVPYWRSQKTVEMLLEEDKKWLEDDYGRSFFAFIIAMPLDGGTPTKAYQDLLLDAELKREASGPKACYYTTTSVAVDGC